MFLIMGLKTALKLLSSYAKLCTLLKERKIQCQKTIIYKLKRQKLKNSEGAKK